MFPILVWSQIPSIQLLLVYAASICFQQEEMKGGQGGEEAN